MKKILTLVLVLCLVAPLALAAGCSSGTSQQPANSETATIPEGPPPHVKDKSVDVVAVYGKPNSEPIKAPDSDEIITSTDAFYIFYSDNTYDQYAEVGAQYLLYSSGNYSVKDGDFIVNGENDKITVALEQLKKHTPPKMILEEAKESKEVSLTDLGFVRMFGPDDDSKQVAAVFGDNYRQMYIDDSEVVRKLDSVWIMFEDMSYVQYAYLNDDVILFGSGTYAFDETGDFDILPFEEDSGKITLNMDYMYDAPEDLEPRPITFDLGALGLECFFIHDSGNVQPPK